MTVSASILVVDDEVDTCRNLSDILTDLGYQVDTALDGYTALELARKKHYDIALLDLKMPGMPSHRDGSRRAAGRRRGRRRRLLQTL